MKEILSIIAVLLTFVAYATYYRDILKGQTRPHIYSWSLWGLLTVLIVALQILGGAGPSTWVTASAGLLCVGVVILSLKNGKRYITKSDTVVALLSLLAIVFWLVIKQPVASIILVVIADLLAFIPTVRKSWNHPETETLSLYAITTVRFGLAFFAIENYTILAALWPAAWLFANAAFSIMLIARRNALRK